MLQMRTAEAVLRGESPLSAPRAHLYVSCLRTVAKEQTIQGATKANPDSFGTPGFRW